MNNSLAGWPEIGCSIKRWKYLIVASETSEPLSALFLAAHRLMDTPVEFCHLWHCTRDHASKELRYHTHRALEVSNRPIVLPELYRHRFHLRLYPKHIELLA